MTKRNVNKDNKGNRKLGGDVAWHLLLQLSQLLRFFFLKFSYIFGISNIFSDILVFPIKKSA